MGDGGPLTATVQNFDIKVQGPAGGDPVVHQSEDIDDGVYGVNFLPSHGPGAYKINVLLDGEHITNSPFTVNVGDQSPPVKFPFVPKNAKTSAPITGASLSDFEVHVHGPDDAELKSEVTTAGDEVNYGVIFQPTKKGPHKITVKHKGEHIEGSVFVVDIGGTGGQQQPQQPPQQQQQPQQPQQRKAKFPINPKDQSGNPIKANGIEGFTVEVLDPSDAAIPAELVHEAVRKSILSRYSILHFLRN